MTGYFSKSVLLAAAAVAMFAASATPVSADPKTTCTRLIGGTVKKGRCLVAKSTVMKRANRPLQTYPIMLSTSNVTLDCAGNTFVRARGFKPKKGHYIGVHVRGSSKRRLAKVKVTNCAFRGFDIAAQVSVAISGKLARRAIKTKKLEPAFANSPRHIVLDRLVSIDAARHGFGFSGWIEGATLQNSEARGSGDAGFYFSAYSRRNRIINNRFIANGHTRNREGLSVDASARNIIEGNLFRANKRGGIFLYKNCQEHASSLGGLIDPRHNKKSLPRVMHAHSNVIRANRFVAMPIGIHVASRQSVDQFTRFCGDRSPYSFPLDKKYWLDFAEKTVIEGNRFEKLGRAIIIEDDNATIVGNRFSDNAKDIVVGTKYRARELKRPVRGTTVRGNMFSSANIDRSVDLIHGTRDTTMQGAVCPEKLPGRKTSGNAVICAPKATSLSGGGPVRRGRNSLVETAGCRISGDNRGCRETYACPAGYEVRRVRASCDLENTRPGKLPAWNTVQVTTPSDPVGDGQCRAAGTKIQTGSAAIKITSGRLQFACRERDKNGGDCAIRAEIECARIR